MKELNELIEALESNMIDGDSSAVESNAMSLVDIALEQQKLIDEFSKLVNMDGGAAIDRLIELVERV